MPIALSKILHLYKYLNTNSGRILCVYLRQKLNLNKSYLSFKKTLKHDQQFFLKKKTNSRRIGFITSAIEGVVFINTSKAPVFIGELIKFRIQGKVIKGLIIGLSEISAEVMFFGDTSRVSPGDI